MSTKNLVLSLVKNIVTSRDDVSITSVTEVVLGDSSRHFVSIPSAINVSGKYLDNDRPFEQSFFVKKTIGKTPLNSGDSVRRLFLNEKLVYERIFPLFESISNSSLPRPKYFGASEAYVLLENLGAGGFKVQDVKQGLDKEHTVYVLEKLAWFHACSMKLRQDSPEEFDAIADESPIASHFITIPSAHSQITIEQAISTLSKTGLQKVADHVSKHNLFTVDTLRSFLKFAPEDDSLNVFIHGDCWGNNMMFKHSAEKVDNPQSEDIRQRVLDFKFIDFQATRRCSVLTDVLLFLGTTANSSLFASHLEYFLKSYHESLLEACHQLGVTKTISFESFWREFQRTSEYGLIALCWYLPVHSVDFPPNTDWSTIDPNNIQEVTKDSDYSLYEKKLFDYASTLSKYFLRPVE